MGLDKRNWGEPWPPEKLEEMKRSYELYRLRTTNAEQAERIKQLEQALDELGVTPEEAKRGVERSNEKTKRIAQLESQCRWHEEGSASLCGYPWDTPFNDGYETAKDEYRSRIAQLEDAMEVRENELQEQLDVYRRREVQLEDALRLSRDAFQTYVDGHEECTDADDWMAMMCSMEAHHVTDEAIAKINEVLGGES